MSLVLHYKFNDPATFTTDSSGNSNTLENINGVESVVDPAYGTIPSFSNNPTNYFSLDPAPTSMTGSSSRTYSYWVKQVGASTFRIMFGQATSPEYRVQFSHGNMDINGGSGQSSNPSSFGQWVHISITYDGSTERVYFDGSLTNSSNQSINTGTGPLLIGSAPNFRNGYGLEGQMLDFRVYDDALSDTEINTLYTDGPDSNADNAPVEEVDSNNGPTDVLFNRVTLSTESTPLNFTEFELYDQTETNIALLGTASQTSTWGSANASTGINGGTDETVVSGYSYNFVATIDAGTWTLDLDRGYSLKELNRAVLYNRIGQSGEVNWFIGATINLHSVDDTVTEEIGVGTADLIQTFVITTPASIVESGLVLHVDTSHDSSWDNTGTTIYNLVEGSTSNILLTGSDYTTEENQVNVVYTGAGGTITLRTGQLQVQTVMFWIKRNAVNADEYLIDCREDIGLSYIILGSGSQIGSFWSGDFYLNGVLLSDKSDITNIPLDEWSSVVITGSSPTTGSIKLLNGRGRNMAASLGLVLVYDRVLTQEEVTQNHTKFLEIAADSTIHDTTDTTDTTADVLGIVQDGALGYFDANNTDSYTSGSETMYDLLGSDLTMVTVPGLVPPLNDGGLDFSTQTNYMQTSKKIVIRTISLWYKKTDSVVSNPVFLDQGEVGNFIQRELGGTGTKHGPFFESCTVYVDGVETNLSDWNNLPHGELHNVVFMGSQDSVESILTIFANPAPAYTFRAILYSILLYDRELTGEELLQNYIGGGGTVTVFENIPVTVTPSVFFLDLEWEAVDGALSYKVEYVLDSTTENTEFVTENTSTRLYNLQADSAYTIALFSLSSGSDYEQVGDSGSFYTLENVVENIDAETLKNSEGIVDLTNFESDDIDEHLDALFDTGDLIVRTIGSAEVTTTFVKNGGTVPLEPGAYSFPFSTKNGGGQMAGLGDLEILFDDVNDAVVFDGVSYTNGESFTIDGKIVTVYTL